MDLVIEERRADRSYGLGGRTVTANQVWQAWCWEINNPPFLPPSPYRYCLGEEPSWTPEVKRAHMMHCVISQRREKCTWRDEPQIHSSALFLLFSFIQWLVFLVSHRKMVQVQALQCSYCLRKNPYLSPIKEQWYFPPLVSCLWTPPCLCTSGSSGALKTQRCNNVQRRTLKSLIYPQTLRVVPPATGD